MIAALAAAAGVFVTGLSLDATRAQTEVSEQGQVTDRFTKAVDQLDRAGKDHVQARVGAVHALARLARDSARDHPVIMEVLASFIRMTAQQPRVPTPGSCVHAENAPDLQAALSALGHRDVSHDRQKINLKKICVIAADLVDADLSGADLYEGQFIGADLRGANLSGAHLVGATLASSTLSDATFAGADLVGAELTGTTMRGTNFRGAVLRNANLQGADIWKADFTNADLTNADVRDVIFALTKLDDARLDGAIR